MNIAIKPDFGAIPAPFLRAIEHDAYDPGESDFTVTQIIGPPQQTALRSNDDNEELPKGQYAGFMAVLGTAVHAMLETHVKASEGEEAEERLYGRFLGVLVGGQYDLYEGAIKRLTDYKVTAFVPDTVKEEHFKQAQLNGLLACQNGKPVEDLCIFYLMRDWSAGRAKFDPRYAQTPFVPFVFKYNELLAREYMTTLLKDHISARGGKTRDCTQQEQWASDSQWACKKPANKKARKLYDTEEEAKEGLKAGEIIEERKATKTFCEDYCGFKHCCPQYARESGFNMAPARQDDDPSR